jgi:hypothetical protein
MRGDNLTQAHPKQCPVAGKESLCNKPVASSNLEEGTLLKANHTITGEPAHNTAPTNQLYTRKKQS